ncbi:MAG TPA: hypothetical protein VF669_22035 [Tepidisphaeraceae bacterium]
MGGITRFLMHAQVGWAIHGESAILGNSKRFLDYLESESFPVTSSAAWILLEFTEELEKRQADATITDDDAAKLMQIMTTLEHTLNAEASIKRAYMPVERRIHLQKLIGDVASLMPRRCFVRLPNLAQYDFNEAGKCIAFDRHTAAAFHLLRGTEGVLREYYQVHVKRERVDPMMWGPIINHLRRRRGFGRQDLLNHLDHIRASFRNPTQHPEMIYSPDAAQDLFNLCVDVVGRMVPDLPDPSPVVALTPVPPQDAE